MEQTEPRGSGIVELERAVVTRVEMTEPVSRHSNEVQELLELYAGRLVADELELLLQRLKSDPAASENRGQLLREIVACAIYNGLDLRAAERLVLQR